MGGWWARSVGLVAACGALLTVAAPAAAVTPAALAEWLARTRGPIDEMHSAESDVFEAIHTRTGGVAGVLQACAALTEAHGRLPAVVPTPDPVLTAEMQQAIDDFETATEICNAFDVDEENHVEGDIGPYTSLAGDLTRALLKAEQHLVKADVIVAELAAKA